MRRRIARSCLLTIARTGPGGRCLHHENVIRRAGEGPTGRSASTIRAGARDHLRPRPGSERLLRRGSRPSSPPSSAARARKRESRRLQCPTVERRDLRAAATARILGLDRRRLHARSGPHDLRLRRAGKPLFEGNPATRAVCRSDLRINLAAVEAFAESGLEVYDPAVSAIRRLESLRSRCGAGPRRRPPGCATEHRGELLEATPNPLPLSLNS